MQSTTSLSELETAVTIPQAAAMIGMAVERLRKHLVQGVIQGHTVGGYTLITRAEVARHREALFPAGTVSVASAALQLEVSTSTVYTLLEVGKLQSVKSLDNHVRVTQESIDGYRDRRQRAGLDRTE